MAEDCKSNVIKSRKTRSNFIFKELQKNVNKISSQINLKVRNESVRALYREIGAGGGGESLDAISGAPFLHFGQKWKAQASASFKEK